MAGRAEVTLLLQDSTLVIEGMAGVAREILILRDSPPDGFLDGPACRRLAVVDFDPATGVPLPPPVTFQSPRPGAVTGRYRAQGDETSASSLAINAFGIAFKTIAMFERDSGLGRPVQWAFPGEQLLVVPRAGEWANACYDRRTRSLQFFWFAADDQAIYTALSRDIVSHECGHALLDAVVPSLYDSMGGESIAIHEAIADLVAVLTAIDSDDLRVRVLALVGNDLSGDNAFNSIAEEFGRARRTADMPDRRALRALHNTVRLQDVSRTDPHRLSTVLSGILYDTLSQTYDSVRERVAATEPELSAAAVANKALGVAGRLTQRLIIQGVDLLPPGELGFADVGRAILAADRAAQPDDGDQLSAHRQAFAERFVSRGIIDSAADLDRPAPATLSVSMAEVAMLLASDWAAYRYVDKHREELGIPPEANFRVLPRLDAVKQIGRRDPATKRWQTQRQLILKVSWDVVEANRSPLLGRLAHSRRITTGATVALRWSDGQAVALVRGEASGAAGQESREAMLARLAELTSASLGPMFRVMDDVLEVAGTHALLHLAGGEG